MNGAFDHHLREGQAHLAANQPDLAIAPLRHAVQLAPSSVAAVANLGAALFRSGFVEEATPLFERAVRAESHVPLHHINLAMALLSQGQFERAWDEFEWRHQWEGYAAFSQRFGQPEWRGEEISGKTILLHGSRGFGDTLHLARYVPLLAQRGARVLLDSPPELKRLLATMPGSPHLIEPGQPIGNFDVHCPLMALPLTFGTTLQTIPANVPYLTPSAEDVQRWRARVASAGSRLNVGLVWAGNSAHGADRFRSLTLASLAPLSATHVTFFSLQKGPAAAQLAQSLPGMRIVDVAPELRDFADTAALIACLDLVITVDTSAAHLAGALGRPVWTLLSFAGEWRWLRDREDSPWYPTMRLFRQPALGQWTPVIERVAAELTRLQR